MGHKKKTKNNQNPLVNDILKIFANNPDKSYNYKQLAKLLSINDKSNKQLLNVLLEDLLRKNSLIQEERGKFSINPEMVKFYSTAKTSIIGIVDMKSTGKAFIISEGEAEDVLIFPNNTNRALHGDTVKVHIFPKRKGHKTEGEVIEIIKRAKTKFVGILEVSNKFAFVVPDNTNMPVDIFIPHENLEGAKNGQKVVVEITDWPRQAKNPFGKILHVLGVPGENNVEMNSILAEFGFPLEFPKNVLNDAEKIPSEITESEIKKRRDFRKAVTITIDPEDAKDFDDALSITWLPNGNYEVGVHIADVSHYVKPGSSVDKEGYERGTSIYLVDRTIPMLPEKLSNQLCSLQPHVDKLSFSAVFEMNDDAEIINLWFGKTIINSNHRFNYNEVQEIIEKGEGLFSKEILKLHQLAGLLRKERFKNGSIEFETTEVKFKLDEKGKPLSVYIKEYKDSNKLIEDFMLLANRKVAEIIGKKKNKESAKTFVYRVHDEPNPEKLNTFSEFVSKLGYKMKTTSRKSTIDSFNKLLENVEGKGEQNMIENLAIRTMAKAYYSTDNIGHYGLSFEYYSHFTSPIRRYPDLMVHRLLFEYLNDGASAKKDEYEEKCKHSSDMEKLAADAERASVKYKQVEFLVDKVGQVFDGVISGVSKWGIFVEIKDNKCEGMVSLRDMEDDFYYLDGDNYCVIGQRNGTRYKLGDDVKIKVKRANLSRKQLDFELCQL
ncbi:MAG TPA: ribonuclease R [Bacteroidales bacterium]|nr:ribonuclease R [Bacteroidales bacterium]HPS16628.1 ribonuclease R [Bacteroidales bacterium]